MQSSNATTATFSGARRRGARSAQELADRSDRLWVLELKVMSGLPAVGARPEHERRLRDARQGPVWS